MASKKKSAKKVPAKKKAAAKKQPAAKKKAPAKKKPVAKKKPARAKKPAAKKPAAKRPVRAAKQPTLPEGVTRVEVSVLQINDVAPVNLGIQEDATGTPKVFYGTTQVDTELDDVFETGTSLTSVDWIVTNNAADTVDVTFGTGSAIPLRNGQSTTYPMTMPAAGACNSTNLFVQVEGELKHDPVIKIKRKDTNGRIPNC